MRLQISIQRHNLPPTQILWVVSDSTSSLNSGNAILPQAHPHLASAHPSVTIAQLLEDINDVVPLESADWGLEDYVVEVGGYECLHFMPVGQVLKEQDQILIRALQTHDLRLRRLGGRHQISNDGRHLVDGVTFGKPWLKRNRRPQIHIPPRKRVRLALEEDNQDVSDRQLLIAPSNTHGPETFVRSIEGSQVFLGSRLDNESEDENYEESSTSDDSAGSEDGSAILQAELVSDDEDRGSYRDRSSAARETEALHRDIDYGVLEHTIGSSTSNIEEDQDDRFSEHLRRQLEDHATAARFYDDLDNIGIVPTWFSSPSLETSAYPRVLPDTEEGTTAKKPTSHSGKIQSTIGDSHIGSTSVKAAPHSIFPASITHLNDLDGRHAIKIMAQFVDDGEESDERNSIPRSDGSSDTSGGTDSVEDTDESDQSGAEPSATFTDEHNSEDTPVAISRSEIDADYESTSSSSITSTSSSDITSDSESDSELEAESQGTSLEPLDLPSKIKPTRNQPPPGQGSLQTKKKNKRVKKRKHLDALKAQGILSKDANFADLDAYDRSLMTVDRTDELAKADMQDQVQARKEQLLQQVASPENTRINVPSSLPDINDAGKTDNGTIDRDEENPGSSDGLVQEPESPTHSNINATRPEQDVTSAESAALTTMRRVKLDVASTRRLLFGSLGVRNPRNKDEEDNLRGKFKEERKPAWQSKIHLSAVECEFEGVKLKPPPFPFQQWWDPEAGIKIKELKETSFPHGGSRKRGQRQYYDRIDAPNQYPEEALDFAALLDETGNAALEAQNSSNDDLPNPPTDLSTLESLHVEDLLPSAVIVFQELEVSSATNWQPELSVFRTAQVVKIGDGDMIEVKLAKRDIPVQELQYDEETGKRIYDKFDAPDLGEDEGDEGYRQLSFETLHNAKLLIPGQSDLAQSSAKSPQRVSESFPDAQETIHVAETPEISLSIVDTHQSSQKANVPASHVREGLETGLWQRASSQTDAVSDFLRSPEHIDKSLKQSSLEQLQDNSSLSASNSSNNFEYESPQFNGFSSPPQVETEHPAGKLSSPNGVNKSNEYSHSPRSEDAVTTPAKMTMSANRDSQPDPDGQHRISSPCDGMVDPTPLRLESLIETNSQVKEELHGLDNTVNCSDNDENIRPRISIPSPSSIPTAHPEVVTFPLPHMATISPRKLREPKPFFTGLDGMMSSEEDNLPSLEQIASQVEESQKSYDYECDPPRKTIQCGRGGAKQIPQKSKATKTRKGAADNSLGDAASGIEALNTNGISHNDSENDDTVIAVPSSAVERSPTRSNSSLLREKKSFPDSESSFAQSVCHNTGVLIDLTQSSPVLLEMDKQDEHDDAASADGSDFEEEHKDGDSDYHHDASPNDDDESSKDDGGIARSPTCSKRRNSRQSQSQSQSQASRRRTKNKKSSRTTATNTDPPFPSRATGTGGRGTAGAAAGGWLRKRGLKTAMREETEGNCHFDGHENGENGQGQSQSQSQSKNRDSSAATTTATSSTSLRRRSRRKFS